MVRQNDFAEYLVLVDETVVGNLIGIPCWVKQVERLIASLDLLVLCLVDVADQKGAGDYFVAISAYFAEEEFVDVVVVLAVGIWDY